MENWRIEHLKSLILILLKSGLHDLEKNLLKCSVKTKNVVM